MDSSTTNTTSPTTSASSIPSSRTSPSVPAPNDPAWVEPAQARETLPLPRGSKSHTQGLPSELFDPGMHPDFINSIREITANGSRTRTRKPSTKALEAEKAVEETTRKVATKTKTKTKNDAVKKSTSKPKHQSRKPRAKKVAASPPSAPAATSLTPSLPSAESVDEPMRKSLPSWVDPYDRISMRAYEVYTEEMFIWRINRDRRREGKEETRLI